MGYELYLLKPKEALIIDENLKSVQDCIQNLRRGGVELATDLAGIEKPLRHHISVVRVPDEPERANQWLSLLREHRENLPSVLVISSERLLNLPQGACQIDCVTYNDIVRSLTTEPQAYKVYLLKAYKSWIQGIMGAPENLTLVLHMNPRPGEDTPSAVLEYWKETAEDFNEWFKPWQLYVTKTGILGSQDSKVQLMPMPDKSFALGPTCPQKGSDADSQNQYLLIYDYHRVFSVNSPWKLQARFVEKFAGTEPTHTVLYNPPQDKWARLKMAVDLIAAAVANIAVVDERIWRRREQSAELREKLALANVIVPSDFNYERPSERDGEKMLTVLRDQKIHILVIHQGILEKMFNNRKGEVKQAIENWIESVKDTTNVQFVVVISDRGIPENLPDNARFADYAVVDKFVSETDYSKFYITQSVLATRRAMRMEGNLNGAKTHRGTDSKLA
jgi:hypothetical protein